MLVSIINKINELALPEWIIDAISDSLHLIPFLFIVFLIIEILEFYYAKKINSAFKHTGKLGVLIGAAAAIFPQCGFSVMASGLYAKRIITLGTLIAVYLATSDETIPILLATPNKAYLIIPIIGIKLFIGILMGYFLDFWYGLKENSIFEVKNDSKEQETEVGCCHHDIEHGSKRELIIHPIMHTINIFGFILVITLILNYILSHFEFTSISGGRVIQPVIAAFAGLIPNCAISIGLTMMLIKGTITFGAAMSGLLSNAGLGLLVLLKNNDFKDTLRIIFILLVISIVSGIAINIFTGF